jgi:outer membrane protein assembly factor BamB
LPLQTGGSSRGPLPDPPLVDMVVRSLDRATGQEQWHWDLPPRTRGTSQPLVANGMIIFTIDQQTNYSLVALDADTGKRVWISKAVGNMLSAPALAGNRLWVLSNSGDLIAFDVQTGNQVSRITISPDSDASRSQFVRLKNPAVPGTLAKFLPSPVVHEEQLLVGVCGQTQPPAAPPPYTPLEDGQMSGLAAFDVHTGKQSWFFRAPKAPAMNVPGSLLASEMQLLHVQVSGDHIIALGTQGSTMDNQNANRITAIGCLSISRQTGQLEWYIPMPNSSLGFVSPPPPIVRKGVLYMNLLVATGQLSAGLYAVQLDPDAK